MAVSCLQEIAAYESTLTPICVQGLKVCLRKDASNVPGTQIHQFSILTLHWNFTSSFVSWKLQMYL